MPLALERSLSENMGKTRGGSIKLSPAPPMLYYPFPFGYSGWSPGFRKEEIFELVLDRGLGHNGVGWEGIPGGKNPVKGKEAQGCTISSE